MTIWFTADTHFGHTNILQYCKRPFSSVTEMDEKLIENWKRSVNPDDTIYHLGDFTLAGKNAASVYFQRINGEIFLVPGGHDKHWLGKDEYFTKSGHLVTILPSLYKLKASIPEVEHPQLIMLCHYAMRVWDRAHYGSWDLYGHSHGNLPPTREQFGCRCGLLGLPAYLYRHSLSQDHRWIAIVDHPKNETNRLADRYTPGIC